MKNKIRMAAAGLAVSATTLVGLAVHEGYRSDAYRDIGGVPTIGFGETNGVVMGQKTDPVRALIKLNQSAEAHAKGMVACITAPISQNEYDAYLSFTYNLGVGSFCKYIAPVLNKLDYDAACRKILLFDHVGTTKVAGLTRRRQEEFAKCME